MVETVRENEGVVMTRTDCVIVGGGPAGAVLALLLARKGADVTLLEAHPDFDREFRGDTLHPSTMEIMDQIGLAERILEMPHSRLSSANVPTTTGTFSPINLDGLKTKFPYITLMPQKDFLEFITDEAKRYPGLHLVMSARVKGLIEEDGVVRGVRYEGPDGECEVLAGLTVGADGRGSRVRKLGGFEPVKSSPPMDVLWFRLPKVDGDPEGLQGRIGPGHIAVLIDRADHWQCGYVIAKGGYPKLRKEGIEAFRREFGKLAPDFAERTSVLMDWKDFALLSVESSMPVAGVGINYAIQDAVAAANILTDSIKRGHVPDSELAQVQKRREFPTRFIQRVQAVIQQNVLAPTLGSDELLAPPKALIYATKIPFLRNIPARIISYGIRPERIR